MQGMLKIKLFSLLIFPVLGACTTPQSADVSGGFAKLQLAQTSAVDNCSVGCPSGGSEITLSRQAYTLNNNSSTKFANWVAYKSQRTRQPAGAPETGKLTPTFPPERRSTRSITTEPASP